MGPSIDSLPSSARMELVHPVSQPCPFYFSRPFALVPDGLNHDRVDYPGKSNLMDAISFVFGVASNHLRGKQLKDLIHRYEGGAPNKMNCYVSLVYVSEEGKEVVFKRSIRTRDGSSAYSVDGRNLSFDEYLQSLHEINIFPKLKNFLIFQGSVEQVASKSSKEITRIIEDISGSADLASSYEELALEEKQARDSTIFQYQKKKGSCSLLSDNFS